MSDTLPTVTGSYALWLRIVMPSRIAIGKLGIYDFPVGDYVYLGSAFGKGGLRSRVGRHLSTEKKLHWHIDYFRQRAKVVGCFYLDSQKKIGMPMEPDAFLLTGLSDINPQFWITRLS